MTRFAYCLSTALLGLVLPVAAAGQTIQREGDGDVFIDNRIDRMLGRGNYVAFIQETRTIAVGDTIPTNLLVLGGTVYVEGVVQGTLLAVDADVFLRPGSVVGGDLVNAGGGVYRSELSEVRRRVRSLPRLPYRVRSVPGGVVIVSDQRHRPLDLGRAFGFRIPGYNRVDGFAPEWGFTLSARPGVLGGFTPGVRGHVGWRTETGEPTGGGSAFLEGRRLLLEGGWTRETLSNDRWIRGDVRNSLDFFWDGDDMRNYYDADVAWGMARYRLGDVDGGRTVDLGVRYEHEDASSMRAQTPWTILGDDTTRTNPPIDQGAIQSVIPFVEVDWLTRRTATEARVSVEAGNSDLDFECLIPEGCPLAPSDGSFTRLRLDTEFGMLALRDHTLEIELQLMLPIGGDEPLPRQRWGMLGGSGTIRTVGDGSLYGDHLAYSETEYIIPLRFVTLPRRIVPTFELLHMAGLAWTGERDEDTDFIQNVGVRLNVWALYGRYIVDPASGDSELTFGVSWPFDDEYPWQE